MRIKLKNINQKKFIRLVMKGSNCPSLFELSRRLSLNYSSLKNYFYARRLFSLELFEDLLLLGNLNKNNFDFHRIEENWGQVKGGKISKRS